MEKADDDTYLDSAEAELLRKELQAAVDRARANAIKNKDKFQLAIDPWKPIEIEIKTPAAISGEYTLRYANALEGIYQIKPTNGICHRCDGLTLIPTYIVNEDQELTQNGYTRCPDCQEPVDVCEMCWGLGSVFQFLEETIELVAPDLHVRTLLVNRYNGTRACPACNNKR